MYKLFTFISLLTLFFEVMISHRSVHAATDNSKIKNILYIISDDLKTSTLGCYGNDICQTPNIDRLASNGMVFTRAYAQGTACASSRPSLMFSRYTRNRINPNIHRSFPQLMKEEGWYSARVGKIFHMRVPNDIVEGTDGIDYPQSWTDRFNIPGLEEATPGAYECLNQNIFQNSLENRAGAGHDDRMYVAVKMDTDGSSQPDPKAADKAIELLRKNKDSPFVLAVGFVRPHYPMVAPKSYFDPYLWESIEMPERREGDWDDIPIQGIPKFTSKSKGLDRYPDNQKRMWADYYATVTFMDVQVGKVLDELERLGLRDSTAIIFTSDHGYHLGEHDFWQKSNLHEEVMNVPLIISAPGFSSGVSDSLVELVDIYPTAIEMTGLDVPDECDGLSLLPVLKKPDTEIRDYAFSYHKGPAGLQYALRGKSWSYMHYGKGIEELYDMENDPNQFTNLAKDIDYKKIITRFRNELEIKREGLK